MGIRHVRADGSWACMECGRQQPAGAVSCECSHTRAVLDARVASGKDLELAHYLVEHVPAYGMVTVDVQLLARLVKRAELVPEEGV